jgi:hypothetical protein
LDRESIKLNAYRLLCHFYANKEISRNSDPENRNDIISKLEEKYFHREISKLLIEIAIAIRIMDDQIKREKNSSAMKKQYDIAMSRVNKHFSCMMFDDMSLREVCNKIIHADVVEPHLHESYDGNHMFDGYNWLSWTEVIEETGDRDIPKPDPIKWLHLSGNIRLGGKKEGKQWWHLLEVPLFVSAITELLS